MSNGRATEIQLEIFGGHTVKKSIITLIIIFAACLSGCVAGNTAGEINGAKVQVEEVNAVKIEKPSPAEEANRWADFAGKIIKPFTKGK